MRFPLQQELAKGGLEAKLTKMRTAASQIQVPYRLDQLVDKDLVDIASEANRPVLLAGAKKNI